MAKIKDISGQRFGRLRAIDIDHIVPRLGAMWRCHCDCGAQVFVLSGNLASGNSRSCGCLKLDVHTKHGRSNSRLYHVWEGMIQRCTNPHFSQFADYGGRGITVCERWRDFAAFLADMGEPEAKLSIERRDNDAGYSPDNCYWATRAQQRANQRVRKDATYIDVEGKRVRLSDMARERGIRHNTLHARIKRGWSIERALTCPS